jgi:hypothetical protein
VPGEIPPHAPIGFHNLADEVGLSELLLQFARRAGRRSDQSLDVDLVRVEHQPDHRLAVIRIAADIGQDK